MADDDRAGRRVDRFLSELGNAPVPPDLATMAASRALAESQPAARNRQPLLILAVGFALLAGLTFTVLTGEKPEPTVIPSTAAVDPSGPSNPVPTSTATDDPRTASPSASATDPGSASCGQVVATTMPVGTSSKPLAVFSDPAGLSLYDIESDTLTVLDSQPSGQVSPRFRTPQLVTFASTRGDGLRGDALFELNRDTGSVTELLRFAHQMQGFDWSSDGSLLAYMVATGTETRIGPHALCLFDSQSGETTQLSSIRRPFGTSVGQREETAVTWSPNDRYILAVETSATPGVFVVDLDGRQVVEPRDGTFGRWLNNDRLLYQTPHPQNNEDPGDWLTVSTTDGSTRSFDMPAGYRPALSPNGKFVAYDDGAKTPSIYLFDVARGTSRRLSTGHVAPIWLDTNLIAATAAGPCPREFFCVKPWLATHEVSGGEGSRALGVDPETGENRALALPTTLGELSWFGVIDVSLPRPGS